MAFVLILVLSFYKLVSALFPATSAEAMEVRFFRNQLHAVVHLYRDGEDREFMQMPQYRGRTELVKDSIREGHVSLRLKNITLLDMGLYGCWFSSQIYDEEATWELQVSALGSLPLISVVGYVDGGIQLLCLSSDWFPQPTVKWKGPQGQHLSSDSRVNADGHSLYDVETSIIVEENAGSILCSIHLAEQSHEVESKVLIGALGSLPLISIVGYVDGGIQLLCLSSGWFPQPTVKWKGPQGQHLSSDSRVNADGHSLYDVETSIIVQENAGSISCSIHLAEQSHEVESKVLIG
ncbi:PREDICTED: butyrophilin-like protein 3, partial [Mandrillus leucophaeus]|uniref:butyrophilin-like protein 3 n=1 Tax=Mandrillus leucophaeus TaxID=9568 RepID=UPI0005F50B39